MIITTANCPSCGGPITFKIGSSIVVICEYCNSAIARTDRDLQNLGKVADLVDTQSPLRVGLEGRFDGHPFVLTGRVQIAHSAGGVWDEWYASFGDRGWGWLAESQGRFHMTFARQQADLPAFQSLAPGQPLVIPGEATRFVVAETGVGRLMGAKGEIPYLVDPGATYSYADLSGPGGAFGTIDYRYPSPSLFAGREVSLKEMGISTVVDEFDAEKKRVEAVRLICPNCNGPLDLRAPDASLRVTCPSCNSLLDVDRGNLTYLHALEEARPQRFPLGAQAIFDGVKLTLIGFMVRGCQVEGDWYYWEEYLLYEPSVGFRWLVNGEGGWSFVESVPPGDVAVSTGKVRFQGKRFTLKESVGAVVVYVRGEFYWRVEVGESVEVADYVSRSEKLSMEGSSGEVNWSFGRPVDPTALDRAFDPKLGRSNPMVLPPPRVVAPPRPLPPFWSVFGIWMLLTVLAVGLWIVVSPTTGKTLVSQKVSFGTETVPPRPPSPSKPDSETEVGWVNAQVEQTAVIGSFEIAGEKQFQIDLLATGVGSGNLWLKLVNDATGEVRKESIDISGGRFKGDFASPKPGVYTLYAIRRWVEGDGDATLQVAVREGGSGGLCLPVCFPLVLLIGPILLLIMKAIRAAWSE